MSGEEENVETVPQEEQKVEETPAQGEEAVVNNDEAQNSDANENYAHSADEKEGFQEGDAPRRKKVKRYRTKKPQKKDWNLTNNNHLPVNGYNALKDQHLQSFFVNDRVRTHLRKMYLITKEGYIVEKPDEYRRNKNLLKMHYASQSPKKTTGKRVKTKGVDKSEHEQFIEDVKKEYAQEDEKPAESKEQEEEAPPAQEEAKGEEE